MYKYCTGCIFRHREDSDSLCDMVENRNYNADEENCPYHFTKQEAIQVAMYKVNEKKKFVQEQERKKKEREERILKRRFELHFCIDTPWSFSITNRFTDEQMQDFINKGYIPSTHLSYEDDVYEYGKSKEELINYMVKYLQEYLIEQNEEIVEINDKMLKARTKLDEMTR